MVPDTISDLKNYLAIEPIPGRMLIRRCSAMNWLLIRNHMNKHKILNIVLSFMVILGVFAGSLWGASQARLCFENMNFLLNSDRNLETIQNIKALEGLRENRTEEIIQFMEVRVKSALKYDGIEAATLTQAKEYERKYCKTPCLGIP
jgi:hypothetical protein